MTYTTYKVTITPYTVSGANQGGFLDNVLVQQYGLKSGLTFEQCQDKRRANLRWADIMESLAFEANPNFQNIQAIGAAVDTPATSFYFEVIYAAAGMPATYRNGVRIEGAECVKQWIAEALVNDSKDQCEVFDPTLTEEIAEKFHTGGVVEAHIAVGPRFMILNVDHLADTIAAAKANIAVTV
jgi:hypothetical protein